MVYRIKASPSDLRAAAGEVERLSGDLQASQQQINSQVDFLNSHWKGETASKFQASYGNLRGVMNGVNQALSGAAASLRKAAEELERAEEEAKARARRAFIRGGTPRSM